MILATNPKQKRPVVLERDKLLGPMMVYTPGTTYGAQIAAMLDRHRIQIQESPVCESASAEALLAQVKAGLGSAWIPEILLRDSGLQRCATPDYFDIAYKILLLKPSPQGSAEE